jgi:hypothetical protein
MVSKCASGKKRRGRDRRKVRDASAMGRQVRAKVRAKVRVNVRLGEPMIETRTGPFDLSARERTHVA